MKHALSRRIAAMTAAGATFAGSASALAWKIAAVAVVTAALAKGGAVVLQARTASGPVAAPVSTRTATRVEEPRPIPSATPEPRAETPAAPEHRSAFSRAREPHLSSEPTTQRLPDAVPPPASAMTPTAAPPSPLEEEARLLRQAHQAYVAGDSARALALLDEDARRFPRGALEPERAAERVFVLCAAGARDEGAREAEAFLQLHPAGALASRVQASCAARR
jgi:hypothetical protein